MTGIKTVERTLRIAAGAGMLAYFAHNPAATWALLGLVPLLTGLVNRCPLYMLLRRPEGTAQEPRPVADQEPRPAVDQASLDQPEVQPESASHAPKKQPRKAGGKGRKKARGGRAYTRKQRLEAQVAPDRVIQATDATFKGLSRGTEQPVLVDFWAEWCGPCKMIAPVLDQLALDKAGQARILKVNVDKSPRTAEAFNIRSIPTLVLLKDGEVVETLVGAQRKGKLAKLLDRHTLARAA